MEGIVALAERGARSKIAGRDRINLYIYTFNSSSPLTSLIILKDRELVANHAALAMNEVPCEFLGAINSKLTEAKVDLIEEDGEVEQRIITQGAMTLNISCSAIDYMSHRNARVCDICVVVHECGVINRAVSLEWQQSLVPMDVTCSRSVLAPWCWPAATSGIDLPG